MLYVLQTTVLWAKIRKCSFQAFSTELLSVSMSPLRVSHKFQLLFHFILFSILEDGCCIKVFRILFFYYYFCFFFCSINYLSGSLFLSVIYFPVKRKQERASLKYASKCLDNCRNSPVTTCCEMEIRNKNKKNYVDNKNCHLLDTSGDCCDLRPVVTEAKISKNLQRALHIVFKISTENSTLETLLLF